ncbi:hypothetical protein ACVWVY_005756 [Bradyrhizobium sp. URHC0002]
MVRITMAATMPVCPATGYLKDGVANSVWNVPDVELVDCPDQLRAGVEARHDDRESQGRSGMCGLPLNKMPRNAESVTGEGGAV